MLYSGTNPESYITEYTLVYEDKRVMSAHKRERTVNFINQEVCQNSIAVSTVRVIKVLSLTCMRSNSIVATPGPSHLNQKSILKV